MAFSAPVGRLSRAQHGGHQRAGLAVEDHQRQVTRALVEMIVKRQRLLPIGRVLGMVHVENQVPWRIRETGDELFDQGQGDAIDVLAAGRMFQTRHRRSRGQRSIDIEWQATGAELEHRIVTQTIGIVAVFVAAADLVDALREQVVLGMRDVAGVPGIDYGCIDALGQADLAIDATQQQGPKVG